MQVNKKLSIVIPTFNRADFLDYNLEVHIPMAREHNIEIFVSDNASTDATSEIMGKWMKEYPLLHYNRNETNVEAEKNFEIALTLSQAEYVWLLGDTYQLPLDGIKYILSLLNGNNKYYDAIVFNLVNTLKYPTQDYNNKNELLDNLGALMTCLSVLIYNKDLIENGNFERYQNSYFIQTGVIFEYIADKTFSIKWIQNHSVIGLENPKSKKTNWSYGSKAFEIGCEKWSNFVFSLPPSYNINNKMKCIMDFGKVSGLFTLKNLVRLRQKNILNVNIFFRYKSLFKMTIDYPMSVIFLLSIFPRFLINLFLILIIIVLKKDKLKKIKKILGIF